MGPGFRSGVTDLVLRASGLRKHVTDAVQQASGFRRCVTDATQVVFGLKRDLLNTVDGLQFGSTEGDDQLDGGDTTIMDEESPKRLELSDSQFYYTLAYFD
ncbi:unnamed protein product [Heligmosomoides polygyrus]|uniref:BLOC-1-related complex subunit 7 n=1 Tax=Heligmosomoides polygyrus TaxID=6339 RepID=A0A183GR32_HELPZ|nr:unnamed protein product [Heligmosomoides polygyrus]